MKTDNNMNKEMRGKEQTFAALSFCCRVYFSCLSHPCLWAKAPLSELKIVGSKQKLDKSKGSGAPLLLCSCVPLFESKDQRWVGVNVLEKQKVDKWMCTC